MTDAPTAYWDAAFNLLCQVEGVRLKPYLDTAGNWTIGIGSTRFNGQPVTAKTGPITMAQAEDQCRLSMQEFDLDITRSVTVPLTVGQRAALLSFVYNLGDGNFRVSKLLKLLNQGQYGARVSNGVCSGAAGEFPKWNKQHVNGQLVTSAGLTNRRAIEQAVFLGEYAPASTASNMQLVAAPVMHQVVQPVKTAPLQVSKQELLERAATDALNEQQLHKYT